MKGKVLVLCVMFFIGFSAFAEPGNTKVGIDDTELNRIIKEYLENTFNKYLKRSDLHVSEFSCTTDWNTSTNDKNLNHYLAQARFRNFPINGRILSGRLETSVAVRKNSGSFLGLGLGGKPGIEDKDQANLNIRLLIDDLLSDGLRDSMVRDYITRNYEHPLDININKERLEVYSDKIFSYVSGIVNNNSIVYLKVIFEKQPLKIEKIDIFTIQELPGSSTGLKQYFLVYSPITIHSRKIYRKICLIRCGVIIFKRSGTGISTKGGQR